MLAAGSRVGDYEIECELGAGGMARVYRARHVLLDTQHAIKVLDPELRANADARQRFLDEAKLQAKHLEHPGIIKVSNIVATPEHAALVMELVDGGSLEAEASKLANDPAEIKRIMREVLAAVGYAHEHGVVHRDLKPANVLLAGPERRVKVADFGIAKTTRDVGERKKSTAATARMGTLDYMSPEQIRSSKNVTPRSDIFSLGAMLYELATGTPPFEAENDFDLMEKIVNGRYTPPATRRPGIDRALAAAITRALQTDPDKRFASCAELAAALDEPRTTEVVPAPLPAPPARAARESRMGWILGGLVLAGAGGGAIHALTRHRASGSEVGAPTAADLARYTADLPGDGALMAAIDTSRGTFHCELFADKAPRTVANFIGLATGKKAWLDPRTHQVVRGKPFYDGLSFHRFVADFGIQGGDPTGQGDGGPGYTFDDEIVPSYKHEAGSLAMWSVSPDKAGSQFVIYTRDVPPLDGSETVFGRCAEARLVQSIIDGGGSAPRVTINQIRIGRESAVGRLADLKVPSTTSFVPPRPRNKPDPAVVYAVPVAGAPVSGVSYAKVTLVVGFDYGDPFSYKLRPTLAALQKQYGDDLRIVYRFYPLVFHGPRALIGARAACAAGMMGHFAEMDAALWASYEARQSDMLDEDTAIATVTRMAATIGLDAARFRELVGEPCIQRVRTDLTEMARVGQTGTPSTYVNGRYAGGAMPVESFSTLIDQELAKANERILRQGSSQMTYYQDWVLAKGRPGVDD